MKAKELKKLAKEIAKYEKIVQETDDPEAKADAENQIMYLTGRVDNFEDIDALDEFIQKILEKNT